MPQKRPADFEKVGATATPYATYSQITTFPKSNGYTRNYTCGRTSDNKYTGENKTRIMRKQAHPLYSSEGWLTWQTTLSLNKWYEPKLGNKAAVRVKIIAHKN